MAEEKWLSLTEYSSRYKVSVSTLRRRIKSEKIDYDLRDGKYYLQSKPLKSLKLTREAKSAAPTSSHRVSAEALTQSVNDMGPSRPMTADFAASFVEERGQEQARPDTTMSATASELLAELKRAYALILQEKEEQILQLKEEVADLKTLVRVLEAENDRLKTNVTEAAPIDSWLGQLGDLDIESNT